MASSYNQIGETLRQRKFQISQNEQASRTLVQRLIKPLVEELFYPKEAITYLQRNGDGSYSPVGDLEDVHVCVDGFFHVGVGIEFQAPGQDNIRDQIMVKLKVGHASEGITVSVEGTSIKVRLRNLNDGEAFRDLLQKFATVIGEVYSEGYDAFLSGKLEESHPAKEAASRLLQSHTNQLHGRKLEKAA